MSFLKIPLQNTIKVYGKIIYLSLDINLNIVLQRLFVNIGLFIYAALSPIP